MVQYKYSKKAGALQEAMTQQAVLPPSYVDAHSTQTNLPAVGHFLSGGSVSDSEINLSDQDLQSYSDQPSAFFYTVEEGQQVLMIDKKGQMEVIKGPRRVYSWGKKFRPMKHYAAHPGEFLILRFRDGTQEHLPGPSHCWFDPRDHLSISKEETVQIAAKEAVVVYIEEDKKVGRNIVYGPATFVPQPGEWLHTFSWHGSVGGQGYLKVPNALVFQKLWLMPDQMYHDVTDVRTADDAVLTIKLMLFFELVDIERMLGATHDPVGDFVNAATSDVVEFLSKHEFESFKKNTDKLNDKQTYKQLVSRAEQCGYKIDKVVYRGYGAPPSLQQMHDQATESRTRLQLEKATEQQAQELEDFKLERKLARARHQRGERQRDLEHNIELQHLEQEAALKQDQNRLDANRKNVLLDSKLEAEVCKEKNQQEQEHLSSLAKLGVDLTQLLTKNRADKVIELRGSPTASHIHLPKE